MFEVTCVECGRSFDLFDDEQKHEAFTHKCEETLGTNNTRSNYPPNDVEKGQA